MHIWEQALHRKHAPAAPKPQGEKTRPGEHSSPTPIAISSWA